MKKPLKWHVIKQAICLQYDQQSRVKTEEIDFSEVKKGKNPLTLEEHYMFDFFLIDLAQELGVHFAQLPEVRIEEEWTYFEMQNTGDSMNEEVENNHEAIQNTSRIYALEKIPRASLNF